MNTDDLTRRGFVTQTGITALLICSSEARTWPSVP